MRFKRWLWGRVWHRRYFVPGSTRCYRCGYHYNVKHKRDR